MHFFSDSAALLLAGPTLDASVRPTMRRAFDRHKSETFVTTPETRYVPGLWHEEARASKAVFLGSKLHILANECLETVKKAAVGIPRTLPNMPLFQYQVYEDALFHRLPVQKAIETGIRLRDGELCTYELAKKALSPVYVKRYVFDDKIHTTTITDV